MNHLVVSSVSANRVTATPEKAGDFIISQFTEITT
jgi:hypothetical protein